MWKTRGIYGRTPRLRFDPGNLGLVRHDLLEEDGKRHILRSAAPGCAGPVLKTLGTALPPLILLASRHHPGHTPKSAAENPAVVVPIPTRARYALI